MAGFIILIGLTLGFVLYLIPEAVRHQRMLQAIPIRITVSGTRGKSGIVRMLASILQLHGIRTLAKTTGSEATYILPDGTIEPVRRRGVISILEQKQLVSKACRLGVNTLVAEVMSIHPDNHRVESGKLLRPNNTILTNFRADHTDVVGTGIDEISGLFLHDVLPGSTIILPENEANSFVIKGIHNKKAILSLAPTGIHKELYPDIDPPAHLFPDSLDCVVTLSRLLGVPDETIRAGIQSACLDIGRLQIFRFRKEAHTVWFVSAFAANDPLSTLQLITKAREMIATETDTHPDIIGLLALRSDRGERSRQWLDYLKSHPEKPFRRIFVSGTAAPIFSRRIKNCTPLTSRDPLKVTRQILDSISTDTLVIGMANIHGLGADLIQYWSNPRNST